ncbi:hypothetical protein CEE36_09105 [candidate division TA06 bacterium B3_TA06]|uniref:Uncharacterized protein n=1 Tax=candidate division TA06 bacterium B3_TA06 TaxID=2012487 RepID=A0A532V119_UNCT6|nr:MAG: hypothetical protein CEE36_09105 [candidate division TA06 bacterium B3_TA06]
MVKRWSKDTQKLPKSWSKPRGPREIVKQFRGVEKGGQGRDSVEIANCKYQTANFKLLRKRGPSVQNGLTVFGVK